MVVFNNLDEIYGLSLPTVITLGNFDAIHLGHQEILKQCVSQARLIQGKSMVVTYDHQSGVLFKGNLEFLYLNKERVSMFKNLGLDYLLLIPFSEEIKKMSAEDFLYEILIKKLGAKIIIIGYDHHFGKNREGNIDYLRKKSAEYDFKVIQIDPVNSQGRIISSSRIRSDLVMGEISKANEQLGSPFHIYGTVVHGYHRGELTGFPTANMEFPKKKLIPADGVYLGRVAIDGQLYPCVMNIGKNPTFNNEKLSLEVHIMNFQGNLYEQEITVYFLDKIRNEIKFENIDDLKKQILRDVEYAQRFFGLQ